jgi:RNA polymerase sigma factor (sigma-70 family)
MSDVTRILSAAEAGDPRAAERLLPLVYNELRKLAARKLAREKPGQTLDATALVHEAYLRLVASPAGHGRESGESPIAYVGSSPHWAGRGHFFAAAAEAMQRILVENARRKQRIKHGGHMERVDIQIADLPTRMAPEQLLALDEALEKLKQQDPIKAKLVTLRYFGGMTIEQASEVLGIARVTAHRYWTFSRAWLHQQIAGAKD